MLEGAKEFGEHLRLERERRGLSLEALHAETKVNPGHFAAVERGDYAALPGGVFRRSIVKAYVNATGLDEQTWMQQFQVSCAEQAGLAGEGPEANNEAWAKFAENVRRGRGPRRRPNTARWIGVAALLTGVLAAAWVLWRFYLEPLVRH